MSRSPFSIGSMLVLACAFALTASGCKSQTSSLSLNATVAQADDAGVVSDGGAAGISLCGQLTIERARLVVRRIDLERAPAAADAGAGAAICDCPDGGTVCVKGDDVHVGPFLVDLHGSDLAGGIHQVFDVEVPSGTYEDVRFAISTLGRHQAGGDGGLGEMKDLHASVVAEGTFGGAPFRFVTPIHLQQKQTGSFTVGDGTKSIVLNVDPAGWFVGGDGRPVDPRDPRNRGRILANIRCSVRMSSGAADAGQQRSREFDDDEDEDRCSGDDDDGEVDHHDLSIAPPDRDHGGGDGDGHHACFAPVLDCGAPSTDAGTPLPDAGADAG